VKFGFIAKHRGIWAVDWMCEALGVSRGGFYAWLTRPRSRRSRSDEELGAKVRASFLASDRTYGARRVWHDLIALDGLVQQNRICPYFTVGSPLISAAINPTGLCATSPRCSTIRIPSG
jgi:hypothetical protein